MELINTMGKRTNKKSLGSPYKTWDIEEHRNNVLTVPTAA